MEILTKDSTVNVTELARRFEVAEMTIRRDLNELKTAGLLVRTYGGGTSTGKLRFTQKVFDDYAPSLEKAAIGKLAAGLVSSGQTIMIDCGVTALQVALHLPKIPEITVMTTSLCVAQTFYGSDVDVVLLGGTLRKEFPGVYGPLTERMLNELRVDTLFMGCDAADSKDGFYTGDIQVSSLDLAFTKIAKKVVIVMESAKFGGRAFVRYARPQDVQTVVTDAGLPLQDRLNLEEQGVTVLIAGKDK